MILLPKNMIRQQYSNLNSVNTLYYSVKSQEKSKVTPVIYSENEFELIRFCQMK